MTGRGAALAAALALILVVPQGLPALGQQSDGLPDETQDDLYQFDLDELLLQQDDLFGDAPPPKPAPKAAQAEKGVILRALDKISGEIVDFDLTPGQTKQLGRIQVTLSQCRYPVGNPAGDAYAFLRIRSAGDQAYEFEGWMIASSPALNALDDPRYDVWVLRCVTS